MGKPLLLDTFCKAGGASVGYHRAGFEVVGVDIEPQKRYPFEFHCWDAIEFIEKHGKDFDVIAGSPPCQLYSVTAPLSSGNHPDLVAPTREAMIKTGKPYVIENVPGAPLVNPIKLCGTMFNLRVIRHRLFECNPVVWWPPRPCQHVYKTAKKGFYDTGKNGYITVVGHNFNIEFARIAMDIDWMTRDELAQAIPPAYTEWLGKEIRRLLNV
jgi:DNA (cytosine-5)-methyltransferase 1